MPSFTSTTTQTPPSAEALNRLNEIRLEIESLEEERLHRIAEARAVGISMSEVAEVLGVSRMTIHRWTSK